MREVSGVLIAFAIVLGGSWLAVEAFDDRELFVPPPEAIAEQFARSVMAKRWEPAKECLRSPDAVSDEHLQSLQQELGERENVEAETVARTGERALVTVRVPKRFVVKNFQLVFDKGWKIE